MITAGVNAGVIEVLDVVEEANGLRVTVTSLSPIAITYQEDETLNGLVQNPEDGKYYYYVDGVVDTTKNSLVQCDDGLFYYFENGQWMNEHYGLVGFAGAEFFVVNGIYDTSISGLQLIGDNFYFLAYGMLQDYTGLALYDGQWFYVVNGVLAIDYSGLQDHDGSKFLVSYGQIQSSYTGLYNDAVSGKWYYIVYGQVQTDYTGLVLYDNAWFYLINGELASDYVGKVEYDGAIFDVVY